MDFFRGGAHADHSVGLFGDVNDRWFRLPPIIGLMVIVQPFLLLAILLKCSFFAGPPHIKPNNRSASRGPVPAAGRNGTARWEDSAQSHRFLMMELPQINLGR